MNFTLKSKKAPALILAAGLALTGVTSAGVAEAGSTERVSTTIETVVAADAALDHALLAMKKLEDRSGLDVEEYKAGVAEIVTTFIETREAEYRKMRSTEVLTAFAQARRPDLWKGRNTDTATIYSDTARFADWEVVEVNQRQLRQNANGRNIATVERLPDNAGVKLHVYVRSPKHDSFRGRTLREEQVTVAYKLREEEVERRARADAAPLFTLGFGNS